MRLLRALSAALILVCSVTLVAGEQTPARAQPTDEAEDEADAARRRADEAASLLSDAGSRRAGIEDELAASLTRLSELGAELTQVSVRLDDVRQALARAEADITTVNHDLTVQAVEAYVRSVTISAASVVGTDTAESAMVAAANLEATLGSDQAEVANLTIKRRELASLRRQYVGEQEQVEALQAEVDTETAHLEALLAEADAEVAAAAAAARAADEEYRQALDAVDLARAREQERQRQAERTTTTTTTTTTPGSTTPPGTPTTTAPTTEPVEAGAFPPAVERWRSLVAGYFPASRVDGALEVIHCESNGDSEAYNPYSGASGLFQFLPGTWATVSPRAGFEGASVFDPEANIGTAAWMSAYYESRGSSPWAPWTCRP